MTRATAILSSFVFQPPTSVLRIVVAGAILLALGANLYWRTRTVDWRLRVLLGALRCAAVLGLLAVLLGPSFARRLSESNFRRRLVIALDTSCSMSVRDVGLPAATAPAVVSAESRFEAARRIWLDPNLLKTLRERYDLRVCRYDENVDTCGPGPLWALPAPNGRQTYIASSVLTLLDTEFVGGRPAGLVVIGDGHETGPGDPSEAGRAAAARGVTVHTVCFGAVQDTRDIAVQTFSGQELLFAKQDGRIAARVVQSGYGLAEVNVSLLRQGVVVQRKTVAFSGRTGEDVAFDIREETPGLYEYEIRADPLAGETETENNARLVFVRVNNEKIKVLLVEGRPYWDTKFLAQSLRADNQVELTQFVRYGPRRFHAIHGTTADGANSNATVLLPRTKQELFAYDVLIVGKGVTDFLPPDRLGLLKQYLDERGGGIIFARGRPYDPTTIDGAAAARALAAIEPAEWADEYVYQLKLALTPEGRSHPSFQFRSELPPDVIVQELPGLIGAVRIRREKAAALVLARSASQIPGEEDSMAAVAYQNYGRGKVVAILNEGLWRWALLEPKREKLADLAPFDQFWRRMLRWLVGAAEFLPGQDVALSIAQFPDNLGDPARIEVRLKYPPSAETKASLSVVGPDGVRQPLPLDRSHERAGVLAGTLEPTRPGAYTVRLETPDLVPTSQETRFCVYDYSIERIHTSADPVAMRELSESSGGRALPPNDPNALLRLLDEGRPRLEERPELSFIWDRPWVFGLLVSLLTLEWFLRRRLGLP